MVMAVLARSSSTDAVRRWDLGNFITFRCEEGVHCHRPAPKEQSEVSPARKGWGMRVPFEGWVTRRLRHSNTSAEIPCFNSHACLGLSGSRTFAPPALWLGFAYLFPALAGWANFLTRLRRCGFADESICCGPLISTHGYGCAGALQQHGCGSPLGSWQLHNI